MEAVRSIEKPVISIITPSFNRAVMIVSAIESVLAQDFPSFEHIIVDGGSTDDTLKILKQYPHLKVISEHDQGMYDALNKGLKIASGEIIGFLNTDDMFAENIFSRIVHMFDDPDVMAVTGRAVVFLKSRDDKVKVVQSYAPEEQSLVENLARGGAFFNAWFFRRATFSRIGNFNPDYKIVGDGDFMVRFALNNLKYVMIPDLVYKYRMHEDSLTFDKNGEKRVWSANEHLAMINFHLLNPNLPDSVKKLLIQARTSETVDMAARSIWMWNYRKFLYYSLEGSRYNPSWPLRFLQYILKRGVALLLGKRFAKEMR